MGAGLKRIDFQVGSLIVAEVKKLGTTIVASRIRGSACLVVVILFGGCARLQNGGNSTPSESGRSTVPADSAPKTTSLPVSPGIGSGKAVVRAIRGRGYVWRDGWALLRVGGILRTGDTLRTEGATSADLFLDDNGPFVRMASNTTLLLARLERRILYPGTERVVHTRLHLQEGRSLGNVRQQASGSTFEISTPAGLAQVRGTGYDVTSDGFVQSGSGHILFRDNRREVLLKEGQFLDRRKHLP